MSGVWCVYFEPTFSCHVIFVWDLKLGNLTKPYNDSQRVLSRCTKYVLSFNPLAGMQSMKRGKLRRSQLFFTSNRWTKSQTYSYLRFFNIFQNPLPIRSAVSFLPIWAYIAPNIIPTANKQIKSIESQRVEFTTTTALATKTRQSFRIVSGWIRCTTTDQSGTTRENGLRISGCQWKSQEYQLV